MVGHTERDHLDPFSGPSATPPASAVERIVAELADCTEVELDERIRSLELQRRRIDAEMALTIAAAERTSLHLADGYRTMKAYLRATCNWSNPEVAAQRRLAKALDRVPGLAEALHVGHIGGPQADAFARTASNPRIADRLAEFAPALLDIAEHHRFDDFQVALRRFETLADTDGAHRHRDEAIDDRNVHITTVAGSLHLDATGGDPLVNTELEAIFRRFCEHEFRADAAARRDAYGDDATGMPLPRSHKQRSYDAFVDIMRRANTSLDHTGDAPNGAEPLVNIIIDERTWALVLADMGLAPDTNLAGDTIDPFTGMPATAAHDLLADLTSDPAAFAAMRCETSDGTVVHPHDVLRAALAGHVRRVVVGARSVPIDLGRKSRLFTGPARDAAKLLIRHCEHAGCDLPADFCQVDHVTEWADLGCTDQDNAAVACGPHNRLKHRRRYTTRRDRHGHSYTIRPDGTVILPVGARAPDLTDYIRGLTRDVITSPSARLFVASIEG